MKTVTPASSRAAPAGERSPGTANLRSRPPPETLVGRRLSSVAFAPCAAPAYLAAGGADPSALAAHRRVALDDRPAGSSVSRWMRSAPPGAEIVLRADSLVSLRQAALSGLGAAILPCCRRDALGCAPPRGTPVAETAAAPSVLTHEDIRRTAHASVFTESMARPWARSASFSKERRRAGREAGR